jgi:signal recognition particle subunit SRP54
MFSSLSERLSAALSKITGQAKLTEANMSDTLREVRMALLEADVALPVVKQFIDQVRSQALGQDVSRALNPGQAFLKIVQQALTETMGSQNSALNLATQPPAVILMAGLQGAGKTTTVGKLALLLKDREKKQVGVVSADVYRPAAMEQLRALAEQVGVAYIEPPAADAKPEVIVQHALKLARVQHLDVLLIDTAGRLAIDAEMMAEIRQLHKVATPVETLFVVDAMTGQDAANTARAFGEALPLTGVVLTKADGDARGGAALSVRYITGQPIKFMGMGEKLDALEPFYPDRVASRILGMGDVLSLIEEVERKVDQKKSAKLAQKLQKGKDFDLEDFRDQLQQMNQMGGMSGLMDKLPGMGQMKELAAAKMSQGMFGQMEAIINSMTVVERRFPDRINGSRKRRIASGSGTQIQDVNRLLKQHKTMQKMMKKVGKKGGMKKMMRGMEGMMGGPGGMPPFGR